MIWIPIGFAMAVSATIILGFWLLERRSRLRANAWAASFGIRRRIDETTPELVNRVNRFLNIQRL